MFYSRRHTFHRRAGEGVRRRARRLISETLEKRLLLTAVTSVDPSANSTAADVSTNIAATFDAPINAVTATADNFLVAGRLTGPKTATTVSTSEQTVTFDPATNFHPGETVRVTATSGIQSVAGSPNAQHTWMFRTRVSSGSGQFVDSGQVLGANQQGEVNFGDIDGDGDLDLVHGGNLVWLNDGSGNFSDTGQNLGSLYWEFGDADGDGDLDVIAANNVFMNDGNGIFTGTGQDLGPTGRNRSMDIGDIDGDGDLDAIVGIEYSAKLVWKNDGNGVFTNTGQALGTSNSFGIGLGDFDSDGDLDAFVSNQGAPNRVWMNDGTGVFTDSSQALGGFRASNRLDLGDIDNDGDIDVLVANSGGVGTHVWINDGSGVFTETGQELNAGTTNYSVRLGDLDGDGDLDAYVPGWAQPSEIWMNNGAGSFSEGQNLTFAGDRRANWVDLGDVDGDGDLDVWASNRFAAGARLWLNQNLEPSVSLTVDNASVAEDAGVSTVTASLSAAHTTVVTVDLGVSGTATATEDYIISGTQIVIPVGATSGTVTITAVQDAVDEPDETVIVDISGASGGQEAGTQQVTVTIVDDDEPVPVPDVTLAVDNATIPEEAGVATFTANLSVVTTVPVTIDFSLSGTADAADYSASATQVVVPPGATSGSITVTATQDTVDEPDETVVVNISNVAGGTESGTQQQVITITDDDEPPVPEVTLAVDSATIAEAAGVANFTISLSEATTVPVTVDVSVSGTAAAGDYTISGTQVTIAPGSTSGTVTVTAVQDEADEPDETVIIDIANVAGGNEVGDQQQTTTILDDDIPPSFAVTSLEATDSGFVVNFTNPLDGGDLNLYDTQIAGMGAADVVVSGASSGSVAGSIIVGENSVEFVKSGGAMEADTYTVTLRSATDGFEDTGGMLLDGNGDGTGGDDYVNTWTVAAAPEGARTVSIPDFVRGPGQDVNLPADETTGIPISISEGENVRAADIRISYDPALLSITGATAPAGGTVVVNTTTPGLAILVYFATTALPAGPSDFIQLQATVPAENASANYQQQQILDVHDVVIGDGNDNEFPVVVDDSFHFVTYFADVSGNGRINASDAAQVARYAALIDTGFAASLNTDPIVVGDISGNGRINAADASRVAQFAALIEVPEIPPIPGGVVVTGLGQLVPGLPGVVAAPQRPQENGISPASEAELSQWELPQRAEWGSSPVASHDLVMATQDDEEGLGLALDTAIEELLSHGADPYS